MALNALLLASLLCGAAGGALRGRGFLSQAATPKWKAIWGKTALENKNAAHGKQTCAELVNHGTFFTVDVEVGTPGQKFSIVADTGSNTLIVPSCLCRQAGFCSKDERCFTGTNHSSTFKLMMNGQSPEGLMLTFGSGVIRGVVAQESVQVGEIRSFMKDGIMLMTSKMLNFDTTFEGILGLGVPKNPALEREMARRAKEEQERARQPAGGAGGMPGGASGVDVQEVMKRIQDIIRSHAGTPGASEPGALTEEAIFGKGEQNSQQLQTQVPQPPSFLEQSGLGSFAICFNEATSGVLRLGTPQPSGTVAMGSVGELHWGLDFRGISVGGGGRAARVKMCDPKNMSRGQKTACGAIPDSGTTMITGPRDQVNLVLESVCDAWPRCAQNHTALEKAAEAAKKAAAAKFGFNPFKFPSWSKADIVSLLLEDCERWIDESKGLDELPPLHFHVAGSAGIQQTLEMPGRSYVIESTYDEKEKQKEEKKASAAATDSSMIPAKNASGVKDLKVAPIESAHKKVCLHAFSSLDYVTQQNGPVWILGSPFFYQFNVGFTIKPPSITFKSVKEAPCGACSGKVGLVSEGVDVALEKTNVARRPRWVKGPFRGPSFDLGDPL